MLIGGFVGKELQQHGWCLTLLWDLLPGVGWVHEGGVLDLVVDVLVLVEGERPAQADVDDDANRPHVQRSVVAFTAEHLRRQVGRCPDHRAAERLLSNDTSEAEVAELHLVMRREDYKGVLRSEKSTWLLGFTWGKGSAEASKTFSGFRSQWTMFLKWRCLRATRIWGYNRHNVGEAFRKTGVLQVEMSRSQLSDRLQSNSLPATTNTIS